MDFFFVFQHRRKRRRDRRVLRERRLEESDGEWAAAADRGHDDVIIADPGTLDPGRDGGSDPEPQLQQRPVD